VAEFGELRMRTLAAEQVATQLVFELADGVKLSARATASK